MMIYKRDFQHAMSILNNNRISQYKDGEDIDDWWCNIEIFFELNRIALECLDEQTKITFVKSLLSQKLKVIATKEGALTSIEALKETLKQPYAKSINWKSRSLELKQDETESVQDFVHRVEVTLNRANRMPEDKRAKDQEVLQYLWYRSKPEIRERLDLARPKSLKRALEHAMAAEESIVEGRRPIKQMKVDTININSGESKIEEEIFKEPHKNDINNRFKKMNNQINALKEQLNKSKNDDRDSVKDSNKYKSKTPKVQLRTKITVDTIHINWTKTNQTI